MSNKKQNWKTLFESLPTNKNKTKDTLFKPSKLDIKTHDKNNFDKEKNEFLSKKTKRYKAKKEDQGLPANIKNVVNKYADVLVNVHADDMKKYELYRKYSKKNKH